MFQFKDFKLPLGYTFKPPPAAFQDPFQFYEKLSRIGVDIEPNLWKYYYTLDKVLKMLDYGSKDPFLPESCYVGGISCKYKLPGNLLNSYQFHQATIGIECFIKLRVFYQSLSA